MIKVMGPLGVHNLEEGFHFLPEMPQQKWLPAPKTAFTEESGKTLNGHLFHRLDRLDPRLPLWLGVNAEHALHHRSQLRGRSPLWSFFMLSSMPETKSFQTLKTKFWNLPEGPGLWRWRVLGGSSWWSDIPPRWSCSASRQTPPPPTPSSWTPRSRRQRRGWSISSSMSSRTLPSCAGSPSLPPSLQIT